MPARHRLPRILAANFRPLVSLHFLLVVWVCFWTAETFSATAGEFNSVLSIGDAAPAWANLPTTDDRTASLLDLKNAKIVVLAFTCNSCPYAIDAEDRLIALTNDYQDAGVAVIAVNVNTTEEDSLPAMKIKAKEKSFPFVYAFDESQQIAKDYGAKYTPELFVLDGNRRVAYMGSLDDNPDGRNVTKPHVRDAIDALLAEKPIEVAETVPIGCRIRMERQRRSRGK